MTKITHLCIGAGKMGGALMSAWPEGRWPAAEAASIGIYDPNPGEAAQALIEKGAVHVKFLSGLKDVQYVLLAVKPQIFDSVAGDIANAIPQGCTLISIMAGLPIARLEEAIPGHGYVRAMPNTPAAIGAGITGYVTGGEISDKRLAHVEKLLRAGGDVHRLEHEGLIDMVTAISGSGPAYVFHLVEALEAAGSALGFPEELAGIFARQTIIGAGALLDQSRASAADLRKAVTSPGGTTQAALDVLMQPDGMPSLMREAVNAAHKRAKELGQG